MKSLFRRAGELLLTILQIVVPKSNVIVLYGMPMTEGNLVEVASALVRRYKGRIIWLVDDDPDEWCMSGRRASITFVRKVTMRALFFYLRSEAVFFTHGLFGAVRPSRRQTFVNLWHGDGIKRKPTTETSSRSLVPATYVSGGTKLLTARKVHDFKMSPGSELLFGNPRILQFRDPLQPEFLDTIGVGNRPYLVWMPTFRKSSASGLGYEDGQSTELMTTVVRAADAVGLRVVVKTHGWDAESRSVSGAVPVSDAILLEHNVYLYSLLGGSAGLITDYSSVWTDYLLLDRPIGFLIPDAEMYSRTRGLYPQNVLDWLPGPRLRTTSDIEAFVRAAVSKTKVSDDRRSYARNKLGLVEFEYPADEIIDALAARGCFRRGTMLDDEIDIVTRPRLSRRRAAEV